MIYLGGKARAVFYGARQVREMYAGSALVYRRSDAPLTLTAQEAGSTVALTAVGSPTVSGLMYRLGRSGEWLAYTPGTVVTLAAIGDCVQFWNTLPTLGMSTSSYAKFIMTGVIDGSGSVQSLVNYGDCTPFCFEGLFAECLSLVTPPEFPSMALARYCYHQALRKTGITRAPALPAVTLAERCYHSLFYDCRQMTGPVVLPAPTLVLSCCDWMFTYDTKISSVDVNFTSWGVGTSNWFASFGSAPGTFIKPASLPEERGGSRIPTGYTVVNKEA